MSLFELFEYSIKGVGIGTREAYNELLIEFLDLVESKLTPEQMADIQKDIEDE